jgi:hypothetical protein
MKKLNALLSNATASNEMIVHARISKRSKGARTTFHRKCVARRGQAARLPVVTIITIFQPMSTGV